MSYLNHNSYFTKNISNCVILSETIDRFRIVEFLLRTWQLINKNIELNIDLISYGYHHNDTEFKNVNNFLKGISTENMSIHMINLNLDRQKSMNEYKRILEEYETQNTSGIVPINKYRLVIIDNIASELMNIKFSIAPHIILMYLSHAPIIPSTISYIISHIKHLDFIKPFIETHYNQLKDKTNIYIIANANPFLSDLSESVNYVRL